MRGSLTLWDLFDMGRSLTHGFQCTVGIGYCTASIVMATVVSLLLGLVMDKAFCGILLNGAFQEKISVWRNFRRNLQMSFNIWISSQSQWSQNDMFLQLTTTDHASQRSYKVIDLARGCARKNLSNIRSLDWLNLTIQQCQRSRPDWRLLYSRQNIRWGGPPNPI